MPALALALLAAPFLFGLVRLLSTASDWRYLAVALASTVGAKVVLSRRTQAGGVIVRLLAAVAAAALLAALAAVALGARSGISVGVVAISFALCGVSGAALWGRARRASPGVG